MSTQQPYGRLPHGNQTDRKTLPIRTYVTNSVGNTARQRRLFDEVKAWIDTRGDSPH